MVCFFVALPTVPVAMDYFGPHTYARWLLADAANEYERGKVARAQQSLERAYDLSPDIIVDPNFLREFGRIALDPDNPPANTKIFSGMVRQIQDPEKRAEAAVLFASLLLDRKQFENALTLLEEFLPPSKERSPTQHNLLAYLRSLEGKDLELGLKEIDLALKGEDNESFLDTKAWILHQMGRDEEALVWMEKSVNMLTSKMNSNPIFQPMMEAMEKYEFDPPKDQPTVTGSEEESESSQKPASVGWAHQELLEKFPLVARTRPEVLETLATIRFHRWKIYQALGRDEDAEKDRQWLDAFSPKPLDALH